MIKIFDQESSFPKIFGATIDLIINILSISIFISFSKYIIPLSFILWEPVLYIILTSLATPLIGLYQYIDDKYISNKPIVNDCFDPQLNP